jgi:hypothetical protein
MHTIKFSDYRLAAATCSIVGRIPQKKAHFSRQFALFLQEKGIQKSTIENRCKKHSPALQQAPLLYPNMNSPAAAICTPAIDVIS